MIRSAFLKRIAFVALSTALFEVRVPELEGESWDGAVGFGGEVYRYRWVDGFNSGVIELERPLGLA